jgi:hypothetical protein
VSGYWARSGAAPATRGSRCSAPGLVACVLLAWLGYLLAGVLLPAIQASDAHP